MYVASPALYEQYEQWTTGKLQDSSKEVQKLSLSLYRYLCRMSSRSTPYGLFAGTTMLRPATDTKVVLRAKESFSRHARLDMNCTTKLGQELVRAPHLQEQLLFYPNSSLYRAGDMYKYIEVTIDDNFYRSFSISSIEWTPYLEKLLDGAKNGATWESLSNVLLQDDISTEEVQDYLKALEEAQVLVSELEPNMTGDQYVDIIIDKLGKLNGTELQRDKLKAISQELASQEVGVKKYLNTLTSLDSLVSSVTSKHYVQVDMYAQTTEGTISCEVESYIQRKFEKLHKIFSPKPNQRLERFKEKFLARYQTEEVPLTHVLDPDLGIGYDVFTPGQATNTPLVDMFHFQSSSAAQTNIEWGKRESLLLNKVLQAVSQGKKVVHLTDEDVESMSNYKGSNAGGASVLGTLLRHNQGSHSSEVDWKFQLRVISGYSSLNLISRFCHGSKQLAEQAAMQLKEEPQDDSVIVAEVTHLPQARHGNVLLRPQLREYEIPYLSRSTCASDKIISINDLYVSVQNNTVILRSKRLKKQIVPRHTNAFNGNISSLPVFKFFYDLQQQETHYHLAGWDWGFLAEQPFLPRVEYDKLILTPARWVLHKKALPGMERVELENLSSFCKDYFERIELPALVQIVDGDNELLVDTTNSVSLKFLTDKIVKEGYVHVVEFLQTPDNCVVSGPDGKHASELVIPISLSGVERNPWENYVSFRNALAKSASIERAFAPGSDWMYIKVYGGHGICDRIIRDTVLPLVQELKEEHLIEKWFFIRYGDPDNHLRIRFNNSRNPFLLQSVLHRMHERLQPLLLSGNVQKVQVDTYQREIERYGVRTMLDCEGLFTYDSEAVAQLLRFMYAHELDEEFRWKAALIGMDTLLNDFGFEPEEKLDMVKQWRDAFFAEHGGHKLLSIQLDKSYRNHATTVVALLSEEWQGETLGHVRAIFHERSLSSQPHIERIVLAYNMQKGSLRELVQSLLHMFLNRVFNAKQRQHELVLYHFLHKAYRTLLATKKYRETALTGA